MITVTKIYDDDTINSTQSRDVVSTMLKTMDGINIPSLYDNYFISIDVMMDTIQFANRLNFEENVLFRTRRSTKDTLYISLAEAVAYIYTATPSSMTARIPTVISSIENIISILHTFLINDTNVTFKSIFEKMIITNECPSWDAYMDTDTAKSYHKFLFSKFNTNFVHVRYSSIPINSLIENDIPDDCTCIQTLYFQENNNPQIDEMLSNENYKLCMIGKTHGMNALTFIVSGKLLPFNIKFIQLSYSKLGI